MKPVTERMGWTLSAAGLLALAFATLQVAVLGDALEVQVMAAGDDAKPGSSKKKTAASQKATAGEKSAEGEAAEGQPRLPRSESEWKRKLTPEQFYVLRRKGTERAFANAYWNSSKKGTYHCAGCDEPLFHSDDKFDSGTGWPSFTAPYDVKNIDTKPDRSFFTIRTEVICRRCKGHLGHVFEDGPPPTGLRYCMNSAALRLEEEEK